MAELVVRMTCVHLCGPHVISQVYDDMEPDDTFLSACSQLRVPDIPLTEFSQKALRSIGSSDAASRLTYVRCGTMIDEHARISPNIVELVVSEKLVQVTSRHESTRSIQCSTNAEQVDSLEYFKELDVTRLRYLWKVRAMANKFTASL